MTRIVRSRTIAVVNRRRLEMSSREELLGAQVLKLVDHFHHKPDEDHNHRHRRRNDHRELRAVGMTAIEALALVSLAHRLQSRARRLASAAATAYVKHRIDDRHAEHDRHG
jgi:hypothetical protein